MKKNIYIFDEYTTSQKNGIGTYLRELLYCLRREDCNFTLIVLNAEASEFSLIEEDGVKKILFPVFKSGFFLDQTHIINTLLRLYIKDSSENVFFVNHAPCGKLLESLKRDFPLSKSVFVIHDLGWTLPLLGDEKAYVKLIGKSNKNGSLKKGINNLYREEKWIYELSDKVVCLSKDTYTVLRKIYKLPSDKIAYIANGLRNTANATALVDRKSYIRENFRIKENDRVVLFIGRPTKQKGALELLDAMNIILKHYSDVKLVIAGDNESSMKELLNKASTNAGSVIFTGQLNKTMLKRWLLVADIGIIPSYYEQCSYVGIEMMMYGLPIVASDGFGIRNMFQDGVNARIAKIVNRKSSKQYYKNLATAILDILGSEELLGRLGLNSKKIYKEKYNINLMRRGYMDLINNL